MASAAIQDGRRRGATGAWALSLALALVASGGPRAVAAGDDGVAPIYHKDRSFRIPFDLGGRDLSRIKELQLWSSEDAGFHWQAASRATPDHKEFMFRARRDGEFWFAVRTMSASGQLSPPNDDTVKPALKVIVDTRPPSLVLESDGRQGSMARVRLEARDENIDLKTLSLEYQVAGARDWRRVPNVRAVAIGRVEWNAGTVEAIRVRATVADRAGNSVEQEVDLPEGAAQAPDLASLDPEAGSAPPVEPFVRGRSPIQADSSFTPVEEGAPAPPAARASSGGWNGEGARRPIARQARAGADALMASAPTPNWDAANSAGPRTAPASAPAPPSSFGPAPEPSRPPGFSDPFPNPGGASAPAASQGAGGGRATEAAQGGGSGDTMLVGGPRFRLRYEVQDPGPDGRAAIVELWLTRDGGRSWIRRGEDPDRASPIDVDLGGEGTFGLTLVARSSSGQGDQPPSPGDMPQTWVEVDSTRPTVHLYRPEIGSGVHAGKVAVSWRAEDLHLAPQPVSLFWRPDQPDAQWVAIPDASQLDAVGQFIWAVPAHFPPKFHVRVEALDLAGNRGYAETTPAEAIAVDRSRPRSRIIGLDDNDRAGAGPSAHISR